MKHLILLCFSLFIGTYLNGQDSLVVITNSATIDFQEGLDPWNGDMCSYIGDPSSGIFNFDIQGFDATAVTISSSNLLVVPIDNDHLSMLLNFNNSLVTGGTVFINPQDAGQSTIIITAYDENWVAVNFYLDLTVKSCRDTQTITQMNIDPLNLSITNTFSANILTQTSGSVVIPNQSDIEFFAGNSIELNPGFEIIRGAEFFADIRPCIN
jgi:hypothetical protein